MRITEKEWQRTVLDAASYAGWTCYHTFDSRRSAPGFPDLVIVKDGRMLALELKTETGKTTPAQERWLEILGAVPGITARVARPSDWDDVLVLLNGAEDGDG